MKLTIQLPDSRTESRIVEQGEVIMFGDEPFLVTRPTAKLQYVFCSLVDGNRWSESEIPDMMESTIRSEWPAESIHFLGKLDVEVV